MKHRCALLLALIGVICSGCHHASHLVLHDTEGRSFKTECSPDTGCQLDAKGVTFRATGRLVAVCNAPAGHPAEASDCRALICKSDADCPSRHKLTHGTCLDGLCIEPAHPIIVDDAVMLCLAGTGLGRNSEKQVERYALAQNCGTPCKVPSPCRQP